MNEHLIKENVFEFPIEGELTIVKKAQSVFVSPFTFREREIMIDLYREKYQSNLFNGKSIRLDHIKKTENGTILEVSLVEFFDFITTTIMYQQREHFITYCIEKNKVSELQLINKLTNAVANIGNKFTDIINNEALSNILAISILVEDVQGNIGLVKRSNNVAISANAWSVTATGSLDEVDFKEKHPFISGAKRELKEELNLEVKNIHVDGLVMSKNKLQPIVLMSAKLEQTWETLQETIQTAKDFEYEINTFYNVPMQALPTYLEEESLTDAARYQLFTKINH